MAQPESLTFAERSTALILIVGVLIFAIWDLLVAIFHSSDATISSVLYRAGCGYPILPYMLALLMGHAFIDGPSVKRLQLLAQDQLAFVIIAGLVTGAILWPNS